MSWDTKDVFARRREFVALSAAGGISFAALCRRFGISRKTGYKWRQRFARGGESALLDRPRGRGRRRNQTSRPTERVVVNFRRRHPTWGPRKLHRALVDLGHEPMPTVSTFAGMTASRPRTPKRGSRSGASPAPTPTNSGKWTSRATSPSSAAAVATR